MSKMILVLLVGLAGKSLTFAQSTGCTIAINGGLPDPQPLILKNGGTNDGFGFHLPTSAGVVNIAANAAVRLACPGSSNYITLLGTGKQDVQATCVSGTTFSIAGINYAFSTLKCQQNPVHTAVRSGSSCYNGNALIDIGFNVTYNGNALVTNTFIKTIQICFSDADLNAVWSKFDLVSGIGGFQSGFPRPSFIEGSFYPGVSVDTQYTKATQTATIANLLGSTSLANQLISTTTDYYLARGHLSAKADFVYGSQQRATFYFINVAPQWATLNGGNWNNLEDNVRTLATTRALNLQVYTGTYGVVTYANTAGVQTPIYLYKDANNNNQIPVPAVLWKVVYDPLTQKGTAMVAVNNPYLTKAQVMASSLYWLCTDVSSQIAWVQWAKDDQKKGIGYCCDVNQLRTQIPSIPSFPVTGLLV